MQALLKKRASVTQSVEQQQQAASISEPLRRCLGPVDVLFLGLGSILGAGCFVLTGLAAHDDAGWAPVAHLGALIVPHACEAASQFCVTYALQSLFAAA